MSRGWVWKRGLRRDTEVSEEEGNKQSGVYEKRMNRMENSKWEGNTRVNIEKSHKSNAIDKLCE